MRDKNKKLARHQITFEGGGDQQTVILAKLGIGNREIARQTGFSDCQISYRLHKAKTAEEKDYGYRVDWRNGNSPILERVLRHYRGILVKEIERKIVPVIIHPTPKTVRLPR